MEIGRRVGWLAIVAAATVGGAPAPVQAGSARTSYGPAGTTISWTASGANHVAVLTAHITTYGYPSLKVFLTSYPRPYLAVNTGLETPGKLTMTAQSFPKDIATKVVVPKGSTYWLLSHLPMGQAHPRTTRALKLAFAVRPNIPRARTFCARIGFIGTEPATDRSDPFPPDYTSQNLCWTGQQWYEASTLR